MINNNWSENFQQQDDALKFLQYLLEDIKFKGTTYRYEFKCPDCMVTRDQPEESH